MSAPVDVLPMPCPFCGEAPTVEHWHGGGPEKRLIGCENEDCCAGPSLTGETLETAVARWNHRATPAAVAELIEAAEYMLVASMQMTPQADQLRDALARVGGEA